MPGTGVMRTGGPAVGMLFTLVVVILALHYAQLTSETDTAAALVLIVPGLASASGSPP